MCQKRQKTQTQTQPNQIILVHLFIYKSSLNAHV